MSSTCVTSICAIPSTNFEPIKGEGRHPHCPKCTIHTLSTIYAVAAAVAVNVSNVVGTTVVDSAGEGKITRRHCEWYRFE